VFAEVRGLQVTDVVSPGDYMKLHFCHAGDPVAAMKIVMALQNSQSLSKFGALKVEFRIGGLPLLPDLQLFDLFYQFIDRHGLGGVARLSLHIPVHMLVGHEIGYCFLGKSKAGRAALSRLVIGARIRSPERIPAHPSHNINGSDCQELGLAESKALAICIRSSILEFHQPSKIWMILIVEAWRQPLLHTAGAARPSWGHGQSAERTIESKFGLGSKCCVFVELTR
jgi:hypothetical protein